MRKLFIVLLLIIGSSFVNKLADTFTLSFTKVNSYTAILEWRGNPSDTYKE